MKHNTQLDTVCYPISLVTRSILVIVFPLSQKNPLKLQYHKTEYCPPGSRDGPYHILIPWDNTQHAVFVNRSSFIKSSRKTHQTRGNQRANE